MSLAAFKETQYQFAAHLREPDKNPAPDSIEDRRMGIYRDLFFNNIESALANAFPVVRQLFSDEHWKQLVRQFYAEHQSHTPLFPDIPQEFMHYLEHEYAELKQLPPFILELCHYEWVELALNLDEQSIDDIPAERYGDCINDIPVRSPVAWALQYQYPVHQIGPDFQPEVPNEQPVYLLVYRTRADEMKFMEINPVTARLFELLENNQRTGLALLEQIAEELQHPQPEVVIQGGVQLFQQLRDADVVIGTAPA